MMRNVTVNTGTTEEFFAHVRETAKQLDRGEVPKPEFTVTFEDPDDMFAVGVGQCSDPGRRNALMRFSYETAGTCATRINIEIEAGNIVNVEFIDGCAGNTQAVAALVKGMPVAEAVRRLKGIACQGDTSCPDQLARALEAAASK
jgi:uncharacterized protein (TIGR03905 family)